MNAFRQRQFTAHEIVVRYADRWRNLRAWGAPLPMKIEVVPHKGTWNLGLAWAGLCKAKVRITGNLARDLATLLHEMAHLAAPNSEHHGARWKEIFTRAAAEAFDCDADDFDCDGTKYDMDQQVMDMCEGWMESVNL